MSIITLPNGIVLDSVGSEPLFLARSANEYTKQLGLESVWIYLATFPSGEQKYLILAQDTIPIYESNSFEAICCHLDMMKLVEEP